jgi:hypothetical protein
LSVQASGHRYRQHPMRGESVPMGQMAHLDACYPPKSAIQPGRVLRMLLRWLGFR